MAPPDRDPHKPPTPPPGAPRPVPVPDPHKYRREAAGARKVSGKIGDARVAQPMRPAQYPKGGGWHNPESIKQGQSRSLDENFKLEIKGKVIRGFDRKDINVGELVYHITPSEKVPELLKGIDLERKVDRGVDALGRAFYTVAEKKNVFQWAKRIGRSRREFAEINAVLAFRIVKVPVKSNSKLDADADVIIAEGDVAWKKNGFLVLDHILTGSKLKVDREFSTWWQDQKKNQDADDDSDDSFL